MRLPDADPKEFMPYRLDSDNPKELAALRRIHDQITNGGCKIGGYPNYLQDDPRLYDEGEGWAECDVVLLQLYDDTYQLDRKSTRLNSSHTLDHHISRMPSSA